MNKTRLIIALLAIAAVTTFSACGGGSGAGGKEQGKTDPGTTEPGATEPGSENPGTTAPGGTATKSSNADLSAISLSAGSLSPEFSADETEYTVNVPYSVKKITIEVQTAGEYASVAGLPLTSAALTVGDNLFAITVTAENGSIKNYTVIVVREAFQSYYITFNSNDSDASGYMNSFSVTDDCLLLPLCQYTKTNSLFKGWAVSPGGEVVYTNNELCPVSENDLVLYAVWTEAVSGDIGIDFEYFEVNGTITITKYTGSDTEVIIPQTINGKPVTALYSSPDWQQGVFCENDSIRAVAIPDSVTIIGRGSFYDCDSLASINFPDSLTVIGDLAFYNCDSLTQVNLPGLLRSICDSAFKSCNSLTTVTIDSANPPSLGYDVFLSNHRSRTIAVPAGSVNSYKTTTGWSTYASAIVSQ